MNFLNKLLRSIAVLKLTRRYFLPRQVKDGCAFYLNGRGYRIVGPNSLSLILECYRDDVYGMRQFVYAPDCIIDVGANIGVFSLVARSYFPNAVIRAFEPNPEIVEYLQKNVEEHSVYVDSAAVGGSSRDGLLIIGSDVTASMISTDGDGQKCTIVSLSDALSGIAGDIFMKLDCEGSEYEILTHPCIKRVSSVAVEFHRTTDNNIDSGLIILKEHGFEVVREMRYGDGWGVVWARNLAPLL